MGGIKNIHCRRCYGKGGETGQQARRSIRADYIRKETRVVKGLRRRENRSQSSCMGREGKEKEAPNPTPHKKNGGYRGGTKRSRAEALQARKHRKDQRQTKGWSMGKEERQ